MALPVATWVTAASTARPTIGTMRAAHFTHRERISDHPAMTADQSRTSSAAAAAPISSACARVSVAK